MSAKAKFWVGFIFKSLGPVVQVMLTIACVDLWQSHQWLSVFCGLFVISSLAAQYWFIKKAR